MARIMNYINTALKKALTLFMRYPFAIIATIVIVAVGVVLAVFGQKMQLGGLLGRLWGQGSKADPNAVLHPPPGRVDNKGQPIEPGKPDDKGWVQPVVLPVKPPSIFSDPSTVTVVQPDGKEVVLQLPTGVKNADVQTVIVVSPGVYQVANHDKGVDADQILKDLSP